MLPTLNDAKKEKLKDALLGLHWAATTGNVGLVKFALDHGVPIDSVVNGFVPLQLACISDSNIAAVQYLIDRGADVNIQKWSKKHSIDKSQAVQGATGSTALHVACANGCVKIVDLLIRNNARIDVKDKYGSTPLDIAHAKHETEIERLLKVARENQRQQRQQKHRSMSCSNDEQESKVRKSIDSVIITHKRTPSDKQLRIRRPSLPSIFEGHQHLLHHNVPSFMSMTPSILSSSVTTTNNSNLELSASRRSSLVHRPPSVEDMHTHSCPSTPKTSLDFLNNYGKRSHASNIPNKDRSPRSSEDSSSIAYSASSSQGSILHPDYSTTVAADDGHPDWYGYGVVSPYDEDNYLLSLERRAFNLGCCENGKLERHSQDSSKRPVTNAADADDTAFSIAATHQQERHQPDASSDEQQLNNWHKNRKRSDSNDSEKKLCSTVLKNAIATNNTTSTNVSKISTSPSFDCEEKEEKEREGDYEDDDEDDVDGEEEVYNSEPLPRPSVVLDNGSEEDLVRYRFLHQGDAAATNANQEGTRFLDHPQQVEAKKGWFSGLGKELGRHSLDNHSISRKNLYPRFGFEGFTQFAKRGVSNKLVQDDDLSEDDGRHLQQQQQQRTGFFSRWTPAWSKK